MRHYYLRQAVEAIMRARGMLAIFLSMLILGTMLPATADAASDFSPRRMFAAATAKIKNAFSTSPAKSKPKEQQQRPAVAQTAAKHPARQALGLASTEQTRVEAPRPDPTPAEAVRTEPARVGETSAKYATPKDVTITSAVPAETNLAAANAKLATIGEGAPKGTSTKRAPESVAPKQPSRAPSAAPPAMPAGFNAYDDILGYALWPQDYAARFWGRGYGDIITALITPSTVTASKPTVTAANADNRKDRRTARSDAIETSAAVTGGMCAVQVEEQVGKTIARLTQTFELNDAQRGHLQELRAALTEAIKRGKAACVATLPTAPAGRLKVATDGLWVMRDANVLFRTPLANFYATLTSDQKAQWNKIATAGEKNDTKQNSSTECSTGGRGLPVDAIEQAVRPTAEQRGGLNVLRQISSDMASYLSGSCPDILPADPVARLDAAGNRVNALLYAVMLFDQTLNGFYLQLSDEQKEVFDKVGGRY